MGEAIAPERDLTSSSAQGEVVGTPIMVGMVLWLASEMMIFAAFFGAYFTLRSSNTVWPPAGEDPDVVRPAAFTALFVLSGVTMFLALRAARRKESAEARAWLLVSAIIGLAFAVSSFLDLYQADFWVSASSYATLYYTIIGVHLLHVLGGVFLAGLVLAVIHGHSRVPPNTPYSALTYYWFFVVALSVVVFFVLYVIK